MASERIPLPVQEAVRDLLGELLNKGCAVEKAGAPLALGPGAPGVVADYVGDDDGLAGVAVADLPMACRSGSALVMMPTTVAEEAIGAGAIEGDMLDCYREVANVLSRLLNSPSTPHVKLRRVYRTGELVPGEVRALLRDGTRRRDFWVDVQEYGEGHLTLIAAA